MMLNKSLIAPIEEEGWMDAEDIVVGDWLRSEVDVCIETVDSTQTYDLDVEQIDTFFVIADEAAILIHHTEPFDPSATGILTAEEVREIQDIVDEFGTEIHVIGSRAGGEERHIDTDFPASKVPKMRSDINMRIDGGVDIDTGGKLSDKLKDVGSGASSLISSTLGLYPTMPPAIIFKPNLPPEFLCERSQLCQRMISICTVR